MNELKAFEPEYTATVDNEIMNCYHNNNLDTVIKLTIEDDAQEILDDWARLDIWVTDVQLFQKMAKKHNVEVDDIHYDENCEYLIADGVILEAV